MGATAVIITGGHARRQADEVVDLLFDGRSFTELRVARVTTGDGRSPHGTGCTFASAVAAGLALGHPLAEAAAGAQRYVAGAMAHAVAVGGGALVLDHFWAHDRARGDRGAG
jgi:hydroxymethylpyrimidine/phosphomethylpyrimidine kinase